MVVMFLLDGCVCKILVYTNLSHLETGQDISLPVVMIFISFYLLTCKRKLMKGTHAINVRKLHTQQLVY